MIGALQRYGLVAIAVLLFGLLATADWYRLKSRALAAQVAALKVEAAVLTARNAALAKSLTAANVAAQTQNALCQVNLARRAATQQILEAGAEMTEEAARPQGVIDAQTSRNLVDFVNRELFGPGGVGVRQRDAGGPHPGPVPQAGPAGPGTAKPVQAPGQQGQPGRAGQ